MKPRDARRFSQIVKLQTDNWHTSDGWILIEGKVVTLTNQRCGESSTGQVTFTRRSFNALMDWYNRDQKVRK